MLTELEKIKIRMYLGFSNVYQGRNFRLENVFQIYNENPGVLIIIRDLLGKLQTIEDSLQETINTHGIKQVDEIIFFGNKDGNSYDGLLSQGRQLISRLSILFGIKPVSDYFGTKGAGSGEWKDYSYQVLGNEICDGDIYGRMK